MIRATALVMYTTFEIEFNTTYIITYINYSPLINFSPNLTNYQKWQEARMYYENSYATERYLWVDNDSNASLLALVNSRYNGYRFLSEGALS